MKHTENPLAREIVEKTTAQAKILTGRQWPEINRILEKEGEIKLSFSVTITNRDTQPSEHADKSSRIATNISFSERFTDKIESALDGSQPELPGVNGDEPRPRATAPAEPETSSPAETAKDDAALPEGGEYFKPIVDDQTAPESTPADEVDYRGFRGPVSETAGNTPVGDVLDAAALAKENLPKLAIKLDIPGGWQLKGLRTEFRVKAKMAKWPQASINAFLEIIKNCDTVDKLKETLRPHVIETTKEPQNA